MGKDEARWIHENITLPKENKHHVLIIVPAKDILSRIKEFILQRKYTIAKKLYYQEVIVNAIPLFPMGTGIPFAFFM